VLGPCSYSFYTTLYFSHVIQKLTFSSIGTRADCQLRGLQLVVCRVSLADQREAVHSVINRAQVMVSSWVAGDGVG